MSETALEIVQYRTIARDTPLQRAWPRAGTGVAAPENANDPHQPPAIPKGRHVTHPLPTASKSISTALTALAGSIVLILSPAIAATTDSSDKASYVLFSPGSGSLSMSGSTEDIEFAAKLRTGQEGLLYVRQGGAAYVIRDPATISRAMSIFEPQRALGAKQAVLGSRQAAIGAEQGRLGRRQVSAPAEHARDIGRAQATLGRQQGALGSEQSALGREQSRLAREAQIEVRALLAGAVQRGLAQRVD
jgi:bla regulator protein BlaR1